MVNNLPWKRYNTKFTTIYFVQFIHVNDNYVSVQQISIIAPTYNTGTLCPKNSNPSRPPLLLATIIQLYISGLITLIASNETRSTSVFVPVLFHSAQCPQDPCML